ncbi:hypothetical protein BU25DRAFT_458744 [Macroventuria anomochaeta]|uniref:Uncharacterized protein n=1 Tax=Macroventuria anomochaeta TaxID=301207 RepID=A0ACB6S2I4_9PLEO|nr:uncharacterized protein BU25DRAFT_458744 [Macroventuria anomochaeta]KAF2627414.1 hypothetical protein BU25DRAFT_458744 [Macroventuria anomochaeta]
MLPKLLLTLSTLATAYVLPSDDLLSDKCTFTLWHRQQSSVNYIQLNTILDHARNISIDVASSRPVTAFNSYTRLDHDHAFAVAGLLDDERLTVTHAGDDVLRFEVGEVKWSTRRAYGKQGEEGRFVRAWCDAWEWEGSPRRRERKLGCAFPCEKVADEDLGKEEYEGVREGDSQARVGLQ